MTAKHLTKNAISHKIVILAVSIAIAIAAVFSISATNQAKAGEPIKNDSILNSKFYSSVPSEKYYYKDEDEEVYESDDLKDGETIKDMYDSLVGSSFPDFDEVKVYQDYNVDHQYIFIEFYYDGTDLFDIGVDAYVTEEESED